ncbi:MAG TPA: transglutaminase-like cysteine peptidase [Sphingomicrobium sp.]|nr:transglutaminase-like cysteine peptidase [Sphingomicrobium sp.]
MTLAAAAAALTVVPGNASAQAIPAGVGGSLAFSKSEAILGAPSALEAILAQQHASVRIGASVQPSAYTLPRLIPAIVRTRPVEDEGVFSGKPDVFGSVALRVTHTPLDARWHPAENARLHGEPARYAESLRDLPPVERLNAVNRYVNRRVRFESDEQQFGRPDVWSAADSTLRSGRGDCEDYAIAKLQMLRTAGISDRDLYLVILRDLVRREDHAVLVVRAAGRMLLLDNGTDQLLDSADVSDYRPVLTFASYGEWTHGYRVSRPAITIASNDQGGDSDDQRSRSASLLAFNTGLRR